jgi:predicted transport protein
MHWDQNGGFNESPLKLNQGLGQLEQWNEDTIKIRAKRLSEMAVLVWQAPRLDVNILEAYRPRAKLKGGYSIEDHPYLLSGVVGKLFEAFRNKVLALDPVVTEEFLKLYVAYKAETNFVDVVPQTKRLRLSLNMPFPDIIDPQGKCKDVSGLGRWGNGDIEVGLSSLDELPYIMGLVRQAFERQMGNGGEV